MSSDAAISSETAAAPVTTAPATTPATWWIIVAVAVIAYLLPLRALLHIMAQGHFENKDAAHPDIRAMFTRDYLLASAWYRQRLQTKQERDIALWTRHVQYLEAFTRQPNQSDVATQLHIPARLSAAQKELARVSSPAYLESLVGTLGADPMK